MSRPSEITKTCRLLLLLAVCAIPFAQAKGTSLYDQLNNQKLNSTDSNDF